MSKSIITLEIDHTDFFDKTRYLGTSAIGERIISVLLDPNNVSFSTDIALRIYGILLLKINGVILEQASICYCQVYEHCKICDPEAFTEKIND